MALWSCAGVRLRFSPPSPSQVAAGRRVVPTELGITLIRGYQLIDPELCRPQVSSSSACRAADYGRCSTWTHMLYCTHDTHSLVRRCETPYPQAKALAPPHHPSVSLLSYAPQVRAHVEQQIGLIAEGKAHKDAVVNHTLEQFRQK
jgi:hypothetical protein